MKKTIVILILIALFIGTFFVLKVFFPSKLPQIGALQAELEKIKKEISAPPPLRSTVENKKSFLTRAGVLEQTNIQRKNNGIAPLILNAKLNSAAAIRAKDMFDNQYFAHESPDGKNAEYAVSYVGYEYIMIGENLALGNFKDDQELVQAWMNSPGHRANLLNPKFQDIGISVLKGNYEGKSTWIAVQIFGRPASSCPQVDPSLKSKIDFNQSQLDSLKIQIDNLRSEIDNMRPQGGPEYNQKVQEYNTLVNQYNNLIVVTKNLVDQYNNQVRLSNQCITGS